MKPCGVQHPWEFGCSWYFTGWDCSVSCWGARLYFNINSVVMHLFVCAVLKGKKNQGRQPVAWASVGTSFPLASRFRLFFFFFPAPKGREQFVYCTTVVGLFQVQPQLRDEGYYLQVRAARSWGGLHSQWDVSPGVIVRSSVCPMIWRQAEIAWDCLWATVCFASEEKGGRGCAGFMWVVPPNLTGIQWLHQTALAHILSWPIGKAIKHESSRDPRLCMKFSLHLLVLIPWM